MKNKVFVALEWAQRIVAATTVVVSAIREIVSLMDTESMDD